MSSNAKRIGGDWVENKDPSSGKVYYANLKTKATSWTWPDELPAKDEASVDDWVERLDPGTGNNYYYSASTRKTTWTKPANFSGAPSRAPSRPAQAASDTGSASDWVERSDPKTGKTYYYNASTRTTSWTKPAGAGDGSSSAAAPAAAAPGPIAASRAAPKAPPGTNKAVVSAAAAFGSAGKPAASVANAADRFAKLRALKAKAAEGGGGAVPSGGGSAAPSSRGAPPRPSRAQGGGGAGSDQAAAPVQSVQPIDLAKLTADLSVDIGGASIEEYAENNFNMNRKGMFGKRTETEKILSWKPKLIRTSLHTMQDVSLTTEAVQAFKNIVSFMGDRQSGKEGGGHAAKLLSNTVSAPEELRDEIFCQLIKQTRNNPSAESTVKGWQLMCLTAGTYPPSKKFEKYLMSYCDANTKQNTADGTPVHPGVKPFAQYAMMKIKKSMSLGPRRETPTQVEIFATKARQPVVLRVHLIDGSYRTVPAESWTTVRELNAMVAKKLGIKDPNPFSTFEVSTGDEERVLDEDERVLDLLSYWTREFQDAKEKKKTKHPPTFKFLFKVRLFFDISDTDTAAVDLTYNQAVHDVTDSRYPCSEQDCHTLAALQAQERFGDASGNRDVLRGKLSDFLPAKYFKGVDAEGLNDTIMKVYGKLAGYTSMEAKLNYLDYVKSWKIYGSAYFFVEPQNSRDFPSDVVLAINAKGILVVDPETKDFLAEYPYSEVVTWGHSQQTFVLVVGNLIRQVKIYCKTDQGVEMNSLVHAYVNKLLDRQK